MGLRDRLKEKVKEALGRKSPAPAPASAPPPPTPPAPAEWAAVARSTDLPDGRAITRARGTEVIAIFRNAGRLYAIDNACAHEDGPVGEGAIHGTRVQCPYHDWEYDFTNGACLTEPDRTLGTWSVREEGGAILLGPRLTEGTGARGGEHNDGMEVIRR